MCLWGCLVAEPDKVLVGELNEWVANPPGLGQTSALQIQTRSDLFFIWSTLRRWDNSAAIEELFSFLGIRIKQFLAKGLFINYVTPF